MVAGLDIVARKTIPELAQRLGRTTGPTTWSKMVGGLSSDARKVLPNHFTPQQLATLSRTADSQPDKVGNIIRAVNDNDSWGIEAGQRYADGIQSRETSEIRRQPQSLEPEQTTDPAIPTDQGIAEDFIRAGGLQDQRLADILKEGAGKKARPRTYDELIDELATLKAQRKALKAGPEKKKLDSKITGLEGKKDQADSWYATKWDETEGQRPEAYKDRKMAQPASTAESQDIPGWKASYHKNLEFHHKNMKVLVAAFHRKLRKMRELGTAFDQDIIDLHRLDESFGVESGSREAAALRMHRATHGYMHREIMLQWKDGMSPIQPDQFKWTGGKARLAPGDVPEEATTQIWDKIKKVAKTKDDVDYILNWAGKDLDIDKGIKKFLEAKRKGTLPVPDNKSDIDIWLERIENAQSPAEIKELYQEMLEDITGPMTQEAELMERVARNQLTKEELIADDRATIGAARERQLDLETDEYGRPKPKEVSW